MAAKPSEAKTSIDSLAELLKERGRMELGKVSQILGIDEKIVEGWARVLEDANLVRISNEVGKMYIEPVTVTKEQEKVLTVTVEAERTKLESEVGMQKSQLDRYAANLDALSTSVKAAEKMFQQRFPDLERQLEGINKIYAALEGENTKIDTIRKSADGTYESINRKVATLYGKVEGVDTNTAQAARDELLKIQETLKKANELENQLELVSKSKDKAIDAIRRGIDEQLKSLQKELGKAEANIDAQLKGYHDSMRKNLAAVTLEAKSVDQISRQVTDFRRDKEAAKKALDDTKRMFNDEYARISTRMDSTGDALRLQIKQMLTELNSMKSSFGEITKLFDSVQKAKYDVDALQKKILELRAELTKLNEEIAAVQAFKGGAEAKSRAVDKINQKSKEIDDAAKQVGSQMDKIGKEFNEDK